PAELSLHHRAGVSAMTLAARAMENPLIRCLCRGLLQFASFTPSKRAYSLHWEFFDGSYNLIVKMSPTELIGLRGRFSLQAAHESLRRSVLQPREPKDVISMLSEPQDGTKALPEGANSLIVSALATHSATHARSFVETAARS